MDSLRYWVIECHVDGFRFDLASALARELYDVDRLQRVLRHDPPGPGALAGQADRRAVGRRPGRLPGRQLPGAVERVERHLPRRRARLLARRRRASRDFAVALHRLERPLRGRRPPAVRVDQLHHRPRRLHAARPRLLQREAQRGQPRGQPRRHRRQPLVELRRRGRRPTTPRSTRCARASSATSSRRCCSRRACRCCSAATSSAARRAATTTPGARTTRSPGSTGTCDERPGASCSTSRERLIALRREHPVFRRAHVPARATSSRARACPTSGGSAPTGADDPARLGARRRARARRVPQRRARSPTATPHGEPIDDDSFLLLFNAHHEDVTFTLPGAPLRRARGRIELSHAPTRSCRRRARRFARAASVTSTSRSLRSCGGA